MIKLQRKQKFDGSFFASQNIKHSTRSLGVTFEDAIKEIVYEMRFDEVSARYGEFGEFYINIRLSPADLWKHLGM